MEQRRTYKRTFRFGQLYQTMVALPHALGVLRGNKKSNLVHAKTIERIMLAVTEVNGCGACSYAHTRIALREGLGNEEITAMLQGSTEAVPEREAKAILFAQHFAETKAIVDRDAYYQFISSYPEEEAFVMIAAMQVILFGNAYGIPYSALSSRLKGNPYHDSTLLYEVGMLVWGLLCLPVALVQALVQRLSSRPIIRFSSIN